MLYISTDSSKQDNRKFNVSSMLPYCTDLILKSNFLCKFTRNVTIHFSMILKYSPKPTNCSNLNAANEGILLKANSSNSTHYLQFYYDQDYHKSTGPRVPLLQFLANNEMVNLTYYGESYVVPGTFVSGNGLRDFSLDITQLINDEVVAITWEQHASTPSGPECDLWSLDNVFVIAKSETNNKTIFSDDFESKR